MKQIMFRCPDELKTLGDILIKHKGESQQECLEKMYREWIFTSIERLSGKAASDIEVSLEIMKEIVEKKAADDISALSMIIESMRKKQNQDYALYLEMRQQKSGKNLMRELLKISGDDDDSFGDIIYKYYDLIERKLGVENYYFYMKKFRSFARDDDTL